MHAWTRTLATTLATAAGFAATALHAGTEGASTTLYGVGAGFNLASPASGTNTFVGWSAGYLTTTQVGNTFLGHRAGYLNIGHRNVAVGTSAGWDNAGNDNTLVGESAGISNYTGSGNGSRPSRRWCSSRTRRSNG